MTTADGRPPGDGRHARPEDPDQAAQTAPAAEPAAEPGEAGPSAPAGNAALAHDTTRAVMAAVTPGLVFRWAVAATVGVFVVGLVFSGLYAVRNILVLVVIALFIAVSLDPAVRWLIRHGVRRSVAVTLIIILLLIVVTAFFVSVVPPLAGQASRLTKDLPRFIEQLPERFRTYRELSDRFNLTDRLSALAASIPSRVGANALGFVQRFLGALAPPRRQGMGAGRPALAARRGRNQAHRLRPKPHRQGRPGHRPDAHRPCRPVSHERRSEPRRDRHRHRKPAELRRRLRRHGRHRVAVGGVLLLRSRVVQGTTGALGRRKERTSGRDTAVPDTCRAEAVTNTTTATNPAHHRRAPRRRRRRRGGPRPVPSAARRAAGRAARRSAGR